MDRLLRLVDDLPGWAGRSLRLLFHTVREAIDDRVPGLAAEIAFFVLLSLPALALTLLAGVGLVGDLVGADWQADLAQQIREGTSLVLQPSSQTVIDDVLTATVEEGSAGIVGFGLVFAIFSASRAFRVIVETVTIAYDLEETRPRWQQRLWGLALTISGLLVGLVVAPLVIAGPRFGATLSLLLGVVPGLAGTWSIAYWPTAAVLLTLMVTALFHVAAPWHTPLRQDLPGALVAVGLWLVGSVGLRAYARFVIETDAAYGPLAGPLVVLLWLYVTAFALLLGAEFNAELHRSRQTNGDDLREPDPGDVGARRQTATNHPRGADDLRNPISGT